MYFLLIILILLLIWYWESRLFLVLFQRLVFLFAKNPSIITNKEDYLKSSDLEKNWEVIRDEVSTVVNQKIDLPRFHEVDAANRKISFNKGPAWYTIILKAFGGWHSTNCTLFPKTTQMLQGCTNVSSVIISILEPGCTIPPHTGKLKGILRYHLGLIIPKNESCYLTLNNEKVYWEEGKSILFDDTYSHSVTNQTDEIRVVLFLNVKRNMPKLLNWINDILLKLVVWSPIYKKGLKQGQII